MDEEIDVFWYVARPTRLPLEDQCETGLLLGATGRLGSLSRRSRGIDPHVKIRKGERAQIKLCQETRCPLE